MAPRQLQQFKNDEHGFIDLGQITKSLGGTLNLVINLIILGAVAGLLFTSIADIVAAIQDGTTNNTTVDLLLPVFGLIVAVVAVFALVRRVMAAAK